MKSDAKNTPEIEKVLVEQRSVRADIATALENLERLEGEQDAADGNEELTRLRSERGLWADRLSQARRQLADVAARGAAEIAQLQQQGHEAALARVCDWIRNDYEKTAYALVASIRRGYALCEAADTQMPGGEFLKVVKVAPPKRGGETGPAVPQLLVPDLANWKAEPTARALAQPKADMTSALAELNLSPAAADPAIRARLHLDPAAGWQAARRPLPTGTIVYQPGEPIDPVDLPPAGSRRLDLLKDQGFVARR